MLTDYSFYRLSKCPNIKPFTCGNEHLNDFFKDDALFYEKELIAVTYLFEDHENTVAYFSVLNDSIVTKSKPEMLKNLPDAKRIYSSYPAVKIGRFGVHLDYQGQGIGTSVIEFIREFFINENKTGCRFITVDAINNKKTLKFYQDNGFNFLTSQDRKNKTRALVSELLPSLEI